MTTMETDQEFFDPFDQYDEPVYFYEDVDEDNLPKRTRPTGAGRKIRNPHASVVDAIAGTGKSKVFTVEDPGNDDERRKLVQRNVRYLRMAAHKNDRSLSVWHETTEDGSLRITFKDKPWHRRGQRNGDGA